MERLKKKASDSPRLGLGSCTIRLSETKTTECYEAHPWSGVVGQLEIEDAENLRAIYGCTRITEDIRLKLAVMGAHLL